MNTKKQGQLLKKADDILSRINNKNSNWYGGMYLCDDKLVMLSTVENNSLLSEFSDDDIVVKTAEYNYDYLVEVQQEICDKLYAPDDSLKATYLPERFALCAIFEDQNRVTVAFEDFTERDIQFFKELITDSEAVTLTSGQKPVCDVSIHPSDILSCNGYFSMGYAAKTNEWIFPTKGFVTCGHINANVGESISLVLPGQPNQPEQRIVVGTVSQIQYDRDLDACFVELTGNNTADNFIDVDTTISEVTDRYLSGTRVTMYGGVSNAQSGNIISTQCYLNTIGDVVLCDYQDTGGDSGSPVLIENTEKLVGIQHGHVMYNGNQCGIYIKAKKINDAFNLVLQPKPWCC